MVRAQCEEAMRAVPVMATAVRLARARMIQPVTVARLARQICAETPHQRATARAEAHEACAV